LSKFDGLFDARGGGKVQGREKGKNGARGAGGKAKLPVEEQPEARPRRGRPSGKRSDPDFVGFTTYIRKDTHRKAKIALLEEGDGRELSELVEELISHWLKSAAKN
jgi:hypothetical protein